MTKKITKDWTIQNLLDKYPESVDILVNYGFHCIGCAMAQYETLGQGAKAHGLKGKKINDMLQELNKIIKRVEKKGKKK